MSGPEPGGSQSVDRAIDALEHLARRPDDRVGAVAQALGVHKSTASRLLAALQARDLVEPGSERGRYRLGPGVLRLAAGVGNGLDLTRQGAAVCDALAAELGETVNLAIRQDDVVVNVHQSEGGGAVSVDSWVGRPTPLHATSSGKVLLAHAPAELQQRVLAHLTRCTEATVTDPAVLAEQLAQARRRGYATTAGELEAGLNAVAAPVRRADGTVVAALSVSAAAFRLPEADLAEAGRSVVAAARVVSSRLGHPG